jgi:cyclohexadienyl dehydratase
VFLTNVSIHLKIIAIIHPTLVSEVFCMIRRKIGIRALGLLLAIALVLAFSGSLIAAERLDRILETKTLRVGTPGDYRPFSILNKETGTYEGHDIELVELLATELGVKVEFVPTTWPKLMEDYQADKFDIAVGGITRSLARMLKGDFLPPYAPNGKVALIRKADKERFVSLEAMDVPETTVIVNPGGTNEKFVNANFKNAKIVVHEKNAEIPAMIAEGKGDVMITEVYEAVTYARKDDRLYGAFLDKPLTKISFMGFFIQKDDPDFLRVMHYLWNDAKLRGDLDKLFDRWLK